MNTLELVIDDLLAEVSEKQGDTLLKEKVIAELTALRECVRRHHDESRTLTGDSSP